MKQIISQYIQIINFINKKYTNHSATNKLIIIEVGNKRMTEVEKKSFEMIYKGFLKGHNGWVTSMQLGNKDTSGNFLVSSSRDKSVLIWKLKPETCEDEELGKPYKMLKGHSHFIEEIALSNDSAHCLTGSWDGLIRLWDINVCKSTRLLKGHTKDVLSVAFSHDNRQIISGSRDRTIRLWNILGENKYTIENAHEDWVSTVRFSPDAKQNLFFSAGWDRKIKVWDKTKMSEYAPETTSPLYHSTHQINTINVAPSGAMVAAGGREGVLSVWGVKQSDTYQLAASRQISLGAEINSVAFSPKYFWIACGCENGIQLYDLNSNSVFAKVPMQSLDRTQQAAEEEGEENEDEKPKISKRRKEKPIGVTSLVMNNAGNLVYAGCTDHVIRVFEIKEKSA